MTSFMDDLKCYGITTEGPIFRAERGAGSGGANRRSAKGMKSGEVRHGGSGARGISCYRSGGFRVGGGRPH